MTNLVRECFGYQFPDILKKPQVTYAFNYLNELEAKSVLLEFDYVDKDFLEDFTRYYAKRFGNDGQRCARMHFFSNTVDHQCITSVLEGGPESEGIAEQLQQSYLGFMVIKPLPRTFIGKTCLRVRPDVERPGKRKQRLKRRYDVDLFGIGLSIESIAFQEQDKVVAACATTAIWSALHALKWKSVRSIPSCSEITMSALNDRDGSSNSFPNAGLSTEQILRSIDAEGLRHHMESARDVEKSRFFETAIGHIDSELPLIYVGDVYGIRGRNRPAAGRSSKPKLDWKGAHAICILGYKSDSEDVLYVHDDRYGPYVRAKLVSTREYWCEASLNSEWALGIQRMEADGHWSEPTELIIPEVLVVPTDKKTRLPFDYVAETCDRIKLALENYPDEVDSAKLTFKIRLREISHIRSEIRKSALLGPGDAISGALNDQTLNAGTVNGGLTEAEHVEWKRLKVRFLTKGFARFQWVAQFFHDDRPVFKVFIDASDIPQGDAVTQVFADNLALAKPYLSVFLDMAKRADEIEHSGHFFHSFLRRLGEDEQSLSAHLDGRYGEVRAPLYLKVGEVEKGDIALNHTRQILYDAQTVTLIELHEEFMKEQYLIWAIAGDGALIIGKELTDELGEKRGHPCITGFKPARIAGELWPVQDGCWEVNARSGRYSGDYRNRDELLDNAILRFQSYFKNDTFQKKLPG